MKSKKILPRLTRQKTHFSLVLNPSTRKQNVSLDQERKKERKKERKNGKEEGTGRKERMWRVGRTEGRQLDTLTNTQTEGEKEKYPPFL